MASSIECDMTRTEPGAGEPRAGEPRPGRLAASLVAIVSLLRGLPMFVSGRPRTPLRVLCLMAFDTVHVLRHSQRLSSHMLETLAWLLDFGACANDFFDDDDFSHREYRTTRRLLEGARSRVAVNEYVHRLRDLENRRPSPGGDAGRHRKVQAYREAVVGLSLGMIAATALDELTIEDGVRAMHHDEDLETLYRIVMLCQIIDDVVDFKADTDGGLPSFLTAHASASESLALTSEAAARYADRRGQPSSPHLVPFRAALLLVSCLAETALVFGRWRLRLRATGGWWALIAGRCASTDAG